MMKKKTSIKRLAAAALAVSVAAGTLASCTDELTLADFIPDSSSGEAVEDTLSDMLTSDESESTDESAAQSESVSSVSDESSADSAAQTDTPEGSSEPQQSPPDTETEPPLPEDIMPSDSSGMDDDASSQTTEIPGESRDPFAESIGLNGGRDAAMDHYAAVIDEYGRKCSEDSSYLSEYCRYYIADIDADGNDELLIETGTCEADRTVVIYTYDGTAAKELGSFVTWHAELGYENGVLYSETYAMGSYTLNKITIADGMVETEKVGTVTDDELPQKLVSYSLTDASGLNSSSGIQSGI